MSRTYVHRPISKWNCYYNVGFPDVSEYYWHSMVLRHVNMKGQDVARATRRAVRHARIDEEDTALTNALAKYRAAIWARNRYW
jgi:hypothetical protein